MPQQLYVSDIDGTLLHSDRTFSDFSRNTITHLLNTGMQFTVASARSVVSIQQVLGDLPLKLPIIEFNGAFLSEFTTGKHILVNSMEKDCCRDILNKILENGCWPFISSFDGNQDGLYYHKIINDGMRAYYENRKTAKDRRLRDPLPLQKCLAEQIVCFTVIDSWERLINLQDQLLEGYFNYLFFHLFEDEYSTGWYWLTIHDKKATKDQAIKSLKEYCGMSDYQITVFGDHINDIKMFQMADRSFAVSNAQDLVKACASRVIGSNWGDAVARFLLDEHLALRQSH
jgi:5-amino-6-(5-phospho-D-ribitylamino)uracil phosphatase